MSTHSRSKAPSRLHSNLLATLLSSLLFIGLSSAGFLILVSWLRADVIDPDYWFHIEISRLWNQSGPPKSLPRILALPWAETFSDKEFLYHAWTSIFYRFWGETGLKTSAYFLGAATTSLLVLSPKLLGRTHLGFRAGVLVLLLILSQSQWIGRMALVRPHTLAVFMFILSLLALLRQEVRGFRLLLWLCCVLFPLTYHAFYVLGGPLLLVALLFPSYRRVALIGLGWMAMGVALHPTPLGLLQMTWTHIRVGTLQTPLPTHLIPIEFFGPGFPITLSHHFWFWGVLLAALLPLFRPHFGKPLGELFQSFDFRKIPQDLRISLLFCLVFYILYLKNFRAIEYLLPSLVICSFLLLQPMRKNLDKKLHLLGAWVIAGAGFAVPLTYPLREDYDRLLRYLTSVTEALKQIPEADSAPIFNCNWGTGSQIFGSRRANPFLDLLDPYFLLRAKPQVHHLREKLVEGEMIHPSLVIQQVAKAQYILCKDGALNLQLSLDPRFERIYPPQQSFQIDLRKSLVGDTSVSLFRLQPALHSPFQRGIALDRLWTPQSRNQTFTGGLSLLIPQGTPRCSHAKLTAPADWVGVELLSISTTGITEVTHLRNRRLLQKQEIKGELQTVRAIGPMLALKSSVQRGDTLEFQFCAPAAYPGDMTIPWVLSAWTPAEQKQSCSLKANLDSAFRDAEFLKLLETSFPRLPRYFCGAKAG